MAKKKQKPIVTTDSNVVPQEPGAETTEPSGVPDISDAKVQSDNPVTSDGGEEMTDSEENPVASSEGDSSLSSADTDGDPLEELRRLIQEEDRQQDGNQSRRWWSRGGKPTRDGDSAGAPPPGESNQGEPADDGSHQKTEGQVGDFLQGGSESGKWWTRNTFQPIRYEEDADAQATGAADEDLRADIIFNKLEEPQVDGGNSGESEDKRDEKYAFVGSEGLNPSQYGFAPIDQELNAEAQISSAELDELKRKAFQPRVFGEDEEDTPEIRSIVLEGEGDVFVEVQPQSSNVMAKRFTAVENFLRPYKGFIYAGLGLLLLIMALIAGLLAFNIYQRFQSPAPVKETVILPYPVTLSLPGGLRFELEKGQLEDGEWNPLSPEWLEGTELCRWVAIPWSTQLEAVVQTLKPNDSIALEMSNNDRVVYKVDSISQLSTSEMQALDSNTPCLVLVLAGEETETRWVVTALP